MTPQELLDSVAADLDPAIDYIAQLCSMVSSRLIMLSRSSVLVACCLEMRTLSGRQLVEMQVSS